LTLFFQMFGPPAFRVIPGMNYHRRLAQALIGSPSELARVTERIAEPRTAVFRVFRATHIDGPRPVARKDQPERMGVMRWLLGARTDPM
jgi:hypothetical protein